MLKKAASLTSAEKEPLLSSPELQESPPAITVSTVEGIGQVLPVGVPHGDSIQPPKTTSQGDDPRSDANFTAQDVYRESNNGKIDIDDPGWTSTLRSAIFANDLELCEALLCCGVPMTPVLLSEIPQDLVEVRSLCSKFHPDIWKAVRMGNVKQVRCLVNLWHRVTLVRDGKPLFQLAIEHSNPYIISLIGGIQTTMEVAHFVLAGDVEKLRSVRGSGKFIKRTLKHFGHKCAPILYFAIVQNNYELVKELCEHFGTKADDEMLNHDGEEIPLIFVAMISAVDQRMLDVLLRHTNRELQNLWYQGKNVMQYALKIRVSLPYFEVILEIGGARIMAERDLLNRTAFDIVTEYEQQTGKANEPGKSYKAALENQIKAWIDDWSAEAGWLAVLGLDFPTVVDCEWCDEVARIQQRIADMDDCIDNNDIEWFTELLRFDLTFAQCPNVAWYGHPLGNGQTLLHRAVILNRKEIVELLLTHADMAAIPLDNFGASPLHYACAASEYEKIEKMLLCAGYGEHYMDKRGQDSQSYRMKRDTPAMARYLEALSEGDCVKAASLDPWSECGGQRPTEEQMKNLPFPKRILTPSQLGGKACEHHNHRHLSGGEGAAGCIKNSMGAHPDSWCSIS